MRLSDVYGQVKAKALLKSVVKSGRLAHAYIFHGLPGVGKFLTARSFAAFLNCESANAGEGSLFAPAPPPAADDACGVCRSCVAVSGGTHENLLVLSPTDKDGEADANGFIRIDAVREVLSALKYRVSSGKKVVIVDLAERFMPQAANAFLKTLEEPPPDSVIILVTSKLSELLPTVLSRCQAVRFSALSVDEMSKCLAGRFEVSSEDAAYAARLSGGSVKAALHALDTAASGDRNEVAREVSTSTLADVDRALKTAEALSKRDDIVEMLGFLKGWFRDRAVAASGAPGVVVNAAALDYPAPVREMLDSYDAVSEAQHNVTPPRNANKQLAMEAMMLRLASLNATVRRGA